MRNLAICSERSSPTLEKLAPPAIDLYSPSLYPTLRWLLFSPVPTQTTMRFPGSTATQPIEYDPLPSKIGTHVVPEFFVFQTPPESAATYQVLCFTGSAAISPARNAADGFHRLLKYLVVA